jgi:hypothetical protein
MHWQRAAVILTLLNLAILAFNLVEMRAAAQSVPQVLRGRALEIVDGHDRVRAEIKVLPADPTVKMPDGSVGYPETVLLRLLDRRMGLTSSCRPLKTALDCPWVGERETRGTFNSSREPTIRSSKSLATTVVSG